MTHSNDRKPTAIVVNDDATQRKILSGLLGKAEVDVREFEGVDAAVEALTTGLQPDLIVTDLYMPGIDGWRFCRLLRSPEYELFNATPILVVSATFSGADANRITADVGANAFLPQPVAPHQFLDVVQALLHNETSIHKPSVLIIEDDRKLTELLSMTFEKHGYDVHSAVNGRQAKGLFLKTAWQVVVIDYHLPDMDSDGLLRDFKRQAPDSVIIMMTGDTDQRLAVEWMKAGAAAYLIKPFDPAYLVELCAMACREQSLLRVEDLLEERTRELQVSEEKYRALYENAPLSYQSLDENGCFLDVNPTWLRTLGYESSEAVIGTRFSNLLHPDWKPCFEKNFQEFKKRGSVHNIKLKVRHKDGHYLDVSLEGCIGYHPNGSFRQTYCVFQDITECVQLEAQLRQAQRLKSIGTLAGGVAHEINNPINGIMNYAQLILDRLGPDSDVAEFATEIGNETRRVALIVKNLLSFARPTKEQYSPARIADIVEATLSLLRSALIRDQISVDVTVPEDIPKARCRSQQIQQVIMSLLANACDSLKEKYPGHNDDKKIFVNAEVLERGRGHAERREDVTLPTSGLRPPTSDNRFLRLTVMDHGPGIPEDTREHLFDPFFTSKRPDKGTGLGLSISHTIIKEHGGKLSVESKVGEWTRFHVDLPIAEREDVEHEA